MNKISSGNENQTFTIFDARKVSPGSFAETGFTLIKLDKEPETKNWRIWSQDLDLFREQMNPYLKELYPQTKGRHIDIMNHCGEL